MQKGTKVDVSRIYGGRRCAAANCGNRCLDGVSMHAFPKDVVRRKQWTDFVRVNRLWAGPTNYSVLCSDHFERDCFPFKYFFKREHMGIAPKQVQLNKDAVPTIHKEPVPTSSSKDVRGPKLDMLSHNEDKCLQKSPPRKLRRGYAKREAMRMMDHDVSNPFTASVSYQVRQKQVSKHCQTRAKYTKEERPRKKFISRDGCLTALKMPRIYCDICGKQFRKGKTFHEHLKKSKCTRISVLMSVLHEANGLEINNPERINSPEKKSQDHTLTNHKDNSEIDTTHIKKEEDSIVIQANENFISKEKVNFGEIKIKKEPDTLADFGLESDDDSKVNQSFSDTDSYTSNTGYEEIQVTANGDIPVSDLDDSGSDWSDDVDWDLLESQGKVETVTDLPPIQSTGSSIRNKGKRSGSKSLEFSKNVAEICKTQKRQQSGKTKDSVKEGDIEDEKKGNLGNKHTNKRKKRGSRVRPRKRRKLSSDSKSVQIETDVSSSDQEGNYVEKLTENIPKKTANDSLKDKCKNQVSPDIKCKGGNKGKTKDKVPTSIQTDSESDSDQNLQTERPHHRKSFRQARKDKYISPKASPSHADKHNHRSNKETNHNHTKEKSSNSQNENNKQKKKKRSKLKDLSSDDQDSNEDSENKPDPKTKPRGRLMREFKQLLLSQSTHKEVKSKNRSPRKRSTRNNKTDNHSVDESPVMNIRSTRHNKQTKGELKRSSKRSGQTEKITPVSDSCSEESGDNVDGDSDFDIDNEAEGSDADNDEAGKRSDTGSTNSVQSSMDSEHFNNTRRKPRKTKHEAYIEHSNANFAKKVRQKESKVRLNEKTQSAIKSMLNKQSPPLLLLNRPVFLVNNHTNHVSLETWEKVCHNQIMFEEQGKTNNNEMDKSEFICGICSKVFHFEDELKHHMRVHISKHLFAGGDNESNVTHHISSPTEYKRQDKILDAQFICGRCKEKFSDSSSLVKHMLSHVVSPNGPSKNRIDNHLIIPSLSGNCLDTKNQKQTLPDHYTTNKQEQHLASSSTTDITVSDSVSSSSINQDNSYSDLDKIDDSKKKSDKLGRGNSISSADKVTSSGVNTDIVNIRPVVISEKSKLCAGFGDNSHKLICQTTNAASSKSSNDVTVTENRSINVSVNGTGRTGSTSWSNTTSTSGGSITGFDGNTTTSTTGLNVNPDSNNDSGIGENDKNTVGQTITRVGPVTSQIDTSNNNKREKETRIIDEAEILKLKNEKKKKIISKLMKYKPSFLKS